MAQPGADFVGGAAFDDRPVSCCRPIDFTDGDGEQVRGYVARVDLTRARAGVVALPRGGSTGPGRGPSCRRGFRFPLTSTVAQQAISDGWELVINANFFNYTKQVGGVPNDVHTEVCGAPRGLVARRGEVVQRGTNVQGEPGDSFVFAGPGADPPVSVLRRVTGTPSLPAGAEAVSGFLLYDGGFVPLGERLPLDEKRARTAIATADDGRTVYVVVVTAGPAADSAGMAIGAFAESIVDAFPGVDAVLNLDGGGSSALTYRPARPGLVARARSTPPSDDELIYRPAPVHLGFAALDAGPLPLSADRRIVWGTPVPDNRTLRLSGCGAAEVRGRFDVLQVAALVISGDHLDAYPGFTVRQRAGALTVLRVGDSGPCAR